MKGKTRSRCRWQPWQRRRYKLSIESRNEITYFDGFMLISLACVVQLSAPTDTLEREKGLTYCVVAGIGFSEGTIM